MSLHRPAAEIAANRARYEQHQQAGLEAAPAALPGPSPRPAPALTGILHAETVPGGWYWATRLRRGEALRVAQTGGHAAVALVCWRADDPGERLHLPDTIKVQWTTVISKGRVLFSDAGRVLLSVIEDSCGAHDVLVGGSTAGSNTAGRGTGRNTRDNLVRAAAKFGLSRRDIPMALTLFAPTAVAEDGTIGWQTDSLRGDDFVDLRAELDLLVALSNCPHPLDPADTRAAVEVTRFSPPDPGPDDICRTATAEARRGFANNAMLLV